MPRNSAVAVEIEELRKFLSTNLFSQDAVSGIKFLNSDNSSICNNKLFNSLFVASYSSLVENLFNARSFVDISSIYSVFLRSISSSLFNISKICSLALTSANNKPRNLDNSFFAIIKAP